MYLVTASVDSTGIVNILGSGGSISPIPGLSALSITTGTDAPAGVVTETGAVSNPTFHGKMSSGKNLIVGTSTQGTSFALHIFVKRVSGVTYSSDDLANKTFRYHRIYTGSSNFWEKANGSTNASSQITLTALEDSSGTLTLPPGNYTAFSVDSTGIVTIGNEPMFSGVLSSDKKIIVGTSTDPAGKYSLRIIQVIGLNQNYTPEDLFGITIAHAFGSSPTSGWAYATRTTDLSGTVTFIDFLDQDGVTTLLGPFTWNVDSQGYLITSITPPAVGGGMTFGKDMIVRVGNGSSGYYMEITMQ
jgi:hypothetical protein